MLKLCLSFGIVSLVCLIFVAAFLFIRATKGGSPLAIIIKTIASVVFLSGGILATYYNGISLASMFVLIGLLFALIGDIVLDLKVAYPNHNKIYLNSGIASFSLSNVMYFIAITLMWYSLKNFAFFSIGSVLISIAFATVIMLLAKPLKLDFTGYKTPVFIYSMFVALTSILSLGISFLVPRFLIFAIGSILVLISDLVLSMMYFGGKQNNNLLCIINHILYYLGELMIVAYLFFQFI